MYLLGNVTFADVAYCNEDSHSHKRMALSRLLLEGWLSSAKILQFVNEEAVFDATYSFQGKDTDA